jgi:TRAP-type C4-dicarboxylate transport system permease large subunit
MSFGDAARSLIIIIQHNASSLHFHVFAFSQRASITAPYVTGEFAATLAVISLMIAYIFWIKRAEPC